MEDYFPLKLKRKDLEDVNDDFSDFSLSSPARKIRRLDAELPPIIEEEECEIPSVMDQSALQEQRFVSNLSGGIEIEELPTEPSNDERAMVLFKPIADTPIVHSPPNFALSLSPEVISGLKNQLMWSRQSNSWRIADDEAEEKSKPGSGNSCLAVVPWVPSVREAEFPSQTNNSEMMEDEDLEEAKMDVEEDGIDIEQRGNDGGRSLSEGFNQWQQQHCLIPQLPQNATAPIVWYR